MSIINPLLPRYPSNFVNSVPPIDVTNNASHTHVDDNVGSGRVIRDEIQTDPLTLVAFSAMSNGTNWTYNSQGPVAPNLTITLFQIASAVGQVVVTGLTDASPTTAVTETVNVTPTIAGSTYTTKNKFRSITAVVVNNTVGTPVTPIAGDAFNISVIGVSSTRTVVTVTAGAGAWNYNGIAAIPAASPVMTHGYSFGTTARSITITSSLGGASIIQVTGTADSGQITTENVPVSNVALSKYTLANKYRTITNVNVLNAAGNAQYNGANSNVFTISGTVTSTYPTDYGIGATTLGTPSAPYTSTITELNLSLSNLQTVLTAFTSAEVALLTIAERAEFAEGKLNRINWLRENALAMTRELNKLLGRFDALGLYNGGSTNTNVVPTVPAFIAALPKSPYPTDLGRNWPHTKNDN